MQRITPALYAQHQIYDTTINVNISFQYNYVINSSGEDKNSHIITSGCNKKKWKKKWKEKKY